MHMQAKTSIRKAIFLLLLVFSSQLLVCAKRGGGGGGFGRGGFGSRGASAARANSGGRASSSGGGGLFGGGSKSHGSNTNYGRSGSGGGGYTGGGYRTSTFSQGSGLGSRSRSHTVRNMLIGAAGGILAYEAGKHVIRSMTQPIYWGNRNYYWGQQYVPGGYASNREMCRMPIDPNDQSFGNVYMPDRISRPKELVWSCGYNEHCCGYECCPIYSGGGYWNGSGQIVLGLILMAILCCCCCALAKKYRDNSPNANSGGGNSKYQQGNVAYTAAEPQPGAAQDPPPPYPVNNGYFYPSH